MFVGESELMFAYANPATIRRSGDMVRMWGLYDFKTVQENPIAGKPYFSERTQIEYDCKGERTRILYLLWHSGQMGGGEVVYDILGPDRWIPVSPGSIIQLLLKFGCDKTSATAEGLIALPSWSASSFTRIAIGSGASIEIPNNWVVLSDNERASIDVLAFAGWHREFGQKLGFAARLHDERGEELAQVFSQLYPENPITQADMQRLIPKLLNDHDVQMRRETESELSARGLTLTRWYGFKTQFINGLYVLIHEYAHTEIDEAGPRRVRVLQVWRGERSFSVRLTCRERDAKMLRPIIDYMAGSLKQD